MRRFCIIIKEGPKDYFFEDAPLQEEPEEENEQLIDERVEEAIERGLALDPTEIRNNLTVDDDNEPAPENRPEAGDEGHECVFNAEWGHNGICYRKSAGMSDTKPSLPNIGRDSGEPSLVNMFDMFFPKMFVINTILAQMNKEIQGAAVQYGEFLRWLGLWFLLATIQGPSRRDFWSSMPIDPFEGAPFRLNEWMSRNRFEEILCVLKFTDQTPPTNYVDRFFAVRQLIKA